MAKQKSDSVKSDSKANKTAALMAKTTKLMAKPKVSKSKAKKEPIELPTDPISWQEITTYLRGNPWIRIPTDEMFAEGGVLIPYRYGEKKLIIRYDEDYACAWFDHYLQSIANPHIKIVINHLIDWAGLDYEEIGGDVLPDSASNIPAVSPVKDDKSGKVPIYNPDLDEDVSDEPYEASDLVPYDDDDDFSDLSSDEDDLFDTPLVAQDDQDIDYSELKAQGEYDD